MAGGIVINGRFIARPGIFASYEYLTLPGSPTQGGVLAVVGEFPYLQQNVPYASLTQADFERLAPSLPDHLRMSNIIYNPILNTSIAGAPAAVMLVSPVPTTQAFGTLLDVGGDASIKVASRMWGTMGNQTRFRIVPNVAIGGWDVVVANNGKQENIRVPAEPSPAVISYAYPVEPGVAGPAPHTSEGFGVFVDDVGSVVRGEVDSDGVHLTFSKVLTTGAVADTASHISWLPNGPIDGALTIAAVTGGVLSTGVLTVKVTGIDATTGLADTELVTFSVAECLAGDSKVTTTLWASVASVSVYTAAAATFTGSVTIAGAHFPVLNEANGQNTVAELIQFLSQYRDAGFTTTTSSPRTASILLSVLDEVGEANLSLTLSADTWKIVTTVNASSTLVTLTDEGTQAPNVPVEGTFFFLAGGSVGSVTAADWGDALDELRWYNVDDVHAFYDPTGTPPASDAIFPFFKTHITTMWSDGANERFLWTAAGINDSFSTLVARAQLFNSERCAVVVDSANIQQYSGATELMSPKWYSLMHAAASASLLQVRSLTRANLRVVGNSRNTATYSDEVVNELLRAGLILTTLPAGGIPRIEREVTTWTTDTNPARTEVICTRSVRASTKDMRTTLDAILSPESAIVTAGALRTQVAARLEIQKNLLNPLISNYDAASIRVVEYADRFDVSYVITVRINKNFITLRVGVTVPVGSA